MTSPTEGSVRTLRPGQDVKSHMPPKGRENCPKLPSASQLVTLTHTAKATNPANPHLGCCLLLQDFCLRSAKLLCCQAPQGVCARSQTVVQTGQVLRAAAPLLQQDANAPWRPANRALAAGMSCRSGRASGRCPDAAGIVGLENWEKRICIGVAVAQTHTTIARMFYFC